MERDDDREAVRISKQLSFWLRHNPGAAGLTLDADGWAEVSAVLASLCSELGRPVPLSELEAVVRGSDKQRFALQNGRIRANQGHSLQLELTFEPAEPPTILFHGTTQERWQKIQSTGGLRKMQRHHVHLSPDSETALRVAVRHRGEHPIVLRIDASGMTATGHDFFRSANGVYLTDHVPLQFLSPTSDTTST